MFGWFSKEKETTMTGKERLVCNEVEKFLINHYLEPFHDPRIPVHFHTLDEELNINIILLHNLLKRTKHPGIEYMEASDYKISGTWFVRLEAI